MPDRATRKITIFISSPTDVMAERERAARVIDRLQSRFREHVTIEAVFFEEKAKYYTADKSFQEQIPDAGASDLMVSIFWSRLGSELAPDLFGTLPDGKPYPGGAVYELMRALAARQRKSLPDILVYRKIAETGLSVTDAQQRRAMNAQLDAFETFWRHWFVSEEGHFRAGFQTFRRPDEFEHLLEGHLRAWLAEKGLLGKEVIWRIAEQGSPFRGLQPYEPEHADVFFGREREIDRGRDRLLAAATSGTGFLLVMGPSGVGKSSIVRAGLATRLTQPGDIEGVDVLRFAVMRPGAAATPQRALAEALFKTQALPELVASDFPEPERLARALMGEAGATVAPILRSLDRLAANLKADRSHDHPVEARLLIVVDQLEELFSAILTEAVRTAFVRLITALARSGRVYVVATLRSADYGTFARETELVALKDAGATLDVAAPGPEVLTQIVRGPPAAAGLTYERRGDRSLDDELLAAAGGHADALPLLGFTLQWLFEHRDGERLTFAAYQEVGGLDGAIGRVAEEAFKRLDPDAQATLPQLLRGLAGASHHTAGLALRDMPLAEAPENTPRRRLADTLVGARVLLIHGEGPGAVLRLAHDAVLRGWERARDITGREQDFYRIRDDVAAAEHRWRARRRNDLLLAPGLPLAEAQSLQTAYGAELAPELLSFIDASVRREQRRQRRGYALAAVFAVVAIVAIGTGVVAWRASNIAAEQRAIAQAEGARAKAEAARAERNFAAAKQTIDAVIVDLAMGLQHVEGMRAETVRRILGRAEAAVGQLASRTDNDPEIRRSQAIMFTLFVDTYMTIGAIPLAADYAGKALAIARVLAAEDPANTVRQRLVSVALGRFGNVLQAQGRLDEALAAYRESLAIARALAAKEPSNAQFKRDVSVNLNKIGDVLVAQGDHAGALAAYRESLEIRRALAAQDPGNAQWQSDVSTSLDNIGDRLMAQGDHAGALVGYREGLEIRRALAARDPSNTEWQRDLSISLNRIGDALEAQGDPAKALAAYRESLGIRRALAAKDPGNTHWQRDVSASLDNIGDMLRAQDDSTGALAAYRESLEIRRTLAARDPGNTQWQRDVSLSLERVGRVLIARGDRAGALAAYRESLGIRRALAGRDPSNARWQRDLSVNLNSVGDVLVAQGDHAGALAAYRESLEIRRALAAKDPRNTGWQRDVLVSLDKLGDALEALGDLTGALAAYRESLAIAKTLVAKDPGNMQWQRDLSANLERVGGVLAAQGNLDEALAAYRDSLTIGKMLVASAPSDTRWRRELQSTISRIGGLAHDFVLARRFATALEVAEQAISLAPDRVSFHRSRAHALMFLGRTDEARALYLKYLGEKKVRGDKSWEAVILEDFVELRKARLTDPLMDEIEKAFEGKT